MFKQPLPSSTTPAKCEASKNEFLKREQDLVDKLNAKQQENLQREQEWATKLNERQQEHLKREEGLLAELRTCQGKPFKYNGCYVDSAARVLSDHPHTSTAMTLKKCETLCQNFTHYGLQLNDQCFCGNTFKNPTTIVADRECDKKCSGNNSETCGGFWRMYVYSK